MVVLWYCKIGEKSDCVCALYIFFLDFCLYFFLDKVLLRQDYNPFATRLQSYVPQMT